MTPKDPHYEQDAFSVHDLLFVGQISVGPGLEAIPGNPGAAMLTPQAIPSAMLTIYGRYAEDHGDHTAFGETQQTIMTMTWAELATLAASIDVLVERWTPEQKARYLAARDQANVAWRNSIRRFDQEGAS